MDFPATSKIVVMQDREQLFGGNINQCALRTWVDPVCATAHPALKYDRARFGASDGVTVDERLPGGGDLFTGTREISRGRQLGKPGLCRFHDYVYVRQIKYHHNRISLRFL
jgi:hypothetical protein